MRVIQMWYHVTFFILLLLSFSTAQIVPTAASEDTLTAALCRNPEQIVSKLNEWRIEYYMGETQLNMKTMKDFLDLNGASSPYFHRFNRMRIGGIALFFGGIVLAIADSYITQPEFPLATVTGLSAALTGSVLFFRSNNAFRMAIYTYNKNICQIK